MGKEEQELEDSEESKPAPKEAKKKKSPLKLIIVVLLVLIFVVVSFVGGVIISGGFLGDLIEKFLKSEGAEKEEETTTLAGPLPEMGPTYAMEQLVVNLANANKYLRVTLILELDSEERREEVTNRLPQITDAIIILLSSKTQGEISTPEQKNQLKIEIKTRIEVFLARGAIRNVYFDVFLPQ